MGMIFYKNGDFFKASEFFVKAYQLPRKKEKVYEKLFITKNIIDSYYNLGDQNKVSEWLEKRIEILKDLGDFEGLAETYLNNAISNQRKNNLNDALKNYELLYKIFDIYNNHEIRLYSQFC